MIKLGNLKYFLLQVKAPTLAELCFVKKPPPTNTSGLRVALIAEDIEGTRIIPGIIFL